MSNTEITKMKQGMSYSCKEKTIILNVFKYFRTQFSDKCVTEIVRCTSKATGCSEKSIFQFRKEESSAEGLKVPSTTKIRRNININSRDIKYDSNVRQTIRNIIYDLKYKNIVPSLNTILKEINQTTDIPKFSLMTLRRLMCDMGFSYEKNGSKSVLVEKPVIKKEKKGKVKRRNYRQQQENNHQTNNISATIVPSNNNNQTNKQYCKIEVENTKLLPMQIPPPALLHNHHQQQQHHLTTRSNIPSSSSSMVLNHRIAAPPLPPPAAPPPPQPSSIQNNFDLHFKREIPQWIQHPTHHQHHNLNHHHNFNHHHNMMITK